ncbi:MAG: recombination mediator RecR [Candidatus Enterosoma sp.]|nr:recombination mediator RecR [Bacilli bacterium]MDD6846659.1 recombination mediator RecR [bacterium]MDY2571565.1 recombination mediator RecR [Candidatus Enterosoma sp.]MCI6525487.1 recombination mediator RecR [Bacilli bacterium]MCI6608440.1 recombination mediator RecR [Bacilli bacterium]
MEAIKTIQDLIECYKKLPGIGFKTAERLAYATLHLTAEDRNRFILALTDANEKVQKCPKCGTFFDDQCPICSDLNRDHSVLLVVSDSKDILSIEKTNGYHGEYFSLKGTLSPLKNRTPEEIGIPQLKQRVEKEGIKEIILALPTDLEGETTAMYLANIYRDNPDVSITKLANGIPIGTDLEYLDNMTITSSLKGRVSLKKGN